MKIDEHNVWAHLRDYSAEERIWLRDYLAYDDPRGIFRKGKTGGKPDRYYLFNARDNRFPAGMIRPVRKRAAEEGFEVEVNDCRTGLSNGFYAPVDVDGGWLRDYQREAVKAALKAERGILWIPTGGGKCLGRGTPVLLADGRIIPVEQVQVGDRLMGPDGAPRTVKSTTQGHGPLYRVVPNKGRSWVCNGPHVLTLVHTESSTVVNVPLNEWLRWSATQKHLHKLYQAKGPFEFRDDSPELPVDPYFLGVWYGDGRRDLDQGVQVSKPDAEIEAACRDEAERWGLEVKVDRSKNCPTYRIVRSPSGGKANPLTVALRELVGDAKRLPWRYLTAPAHARRNLLAGLLDTDGHKAEGGGYFEIIQQREGVAQDIAFLARSLGYRVTERVKWVNERPYVRVLILGDLTSVPLRVPRKRPNTRKQKKNPLRTGFHVEPLGDGEWFGFQLDGDRRFLLGDFTVTHNTEIAIALNWCIPGWWLFIVHRKGLMHQAADRFNLRAEQLGYQVRAGRFGDGIYENFADSPFVVATFQTLNANSGSPMAQQLLQCANGIMVDECHTLPADSFYKLAMSCAAPYRVGMSGTPLARGDKRSMFAVAALGPIVYRLKPQRLIDAGVLAQPHIRMLEVDQQVEAQTWQGVYGAGVVRSAVRNRRVVEAAQRAAKPCLLFVKQVKHGKQLTKRLQKAGLNAEFTWGSDAESKRRAAVQRLEHGDIDVLVCSVIFQEGVDIPDLASVVIASGGKSTIAAIQRIGRGMRVSEGKNTFEVWDFYDRGTRMLQNQAKARRKAYEQEGHRVHQEPAYQLTLGT